MPAQGARTSSSRICRSGSLRLPRLRCWRRRPGCPGRLPLAAAGRPWCVAVATPAAAVAAAAAARRRPGRCPVVARLSFAGRCWPVVVLLLAARSPSLPRWRVLLVVAVRRRSPSLRLRSSPVVPVLLVAVLAGVPVRLPSRSWSRFGLVAGSGPGRGCGRPAAPRSRAPRLRLPVAVSPGRRSPSPGRRLGRLAPGGAACAAPGAPVLAGRGRPSLVAVGRSRRCRAARCRLPFRRARLWPPLWPPPWAALIASTRSPLRMPVALMPSPPASCLSSGSSMAFRPPLRPPARTRRRRERCRWSRSCGVPSPCVGRAASRSPCWCCAPTPAGGHADEACRRRREGGDRCGVVGSSAPADGSPGGRA